MLCILKKSLNETILLSTPKHILFKFTSKDIFTTFSQRVRLTEPINMYVVLYHIGDKQISVQAALLTTLNVAFLV